MAGKVELIPLTCPRCNTAIPARLDEAAWVCDQCKQGWLLQDDEKTGRTSLQPLEVYYQNGISPAAPGWPFWVVDGKVIAERTAFSGNQHLESRQFWSKPQRFFVPAYTCTLDQLVELGPRLLLNPPQLQPGPPAAFQPVVLAPPDIQPYVEFIVMAVEVERKDRLREVKMAVTLSQPALWVLNRA